MGEKIVQTLGHFVTQRGEPALRGVTELCDTVVAGSNDCLPPLRMLPVKKGALGKGDWKRGPRSEFCSQLGTFLLRCH